MGDNIIKNWLIKNASLLIILSSFILYWLIGKTIIYFALILVILFVIWARMLDKIEFYNFDLVIFISYILLVLFGNKIIKNETINVLIFLLGIWFIVSFFKNNRVIYDKEE